MPAIVTDPLDKATSEMALDVNAILPEPLLCRSDVYLAESGDPCVGRPGHTFGLDDFGPCGEHHVLEA